MVDQSPSFRLIVDANTAPLRQELAAAGQLGRTFAAGLGKSFGDVALRGRSFARDLGKAFSDVAVKGRDLKDVFRDLVTSLSKRVLTSSIGSLGRAVGRGLPAPIGGAVGQAVSQAIKSALGFAHGGVLRQGLPVPFARGGVIASPTAFPLAGGRLGVGGRSGPGSDLAATAGPRWTARSAVGRRRCGGQCDHQRDGRRKRDAV